MSLATTNEESDKKFDGSDMPVRYQRVQKAGTELWDLVTEGPHGRTVRRLLCLFALTKGLPFTIDEVAHVYAWFKYKDHLSFRTAFYQWAYKDWFVVQNGEGEFAWECDFASYARQYLATAENCALNAGVNDRFRAAVERHMEMYKQFSRERTEQEHKPHPADELTAVQREAILNMAKYIRFPQEGIARLTGDAPLMDDEDDVDELIDILIQNHVLSHIGLRPDGCWILSVDMAAYREWCTYIEDCGRKA